MNLLIISSPKLGVYLLYLIHAKRALIIQFLEHVFILPLIIFSFLFDVLELIGFAKIVPGEVGVNFSQTHGVELISKVPQQNHIILYQVECQTVPLLWPEVLVVLVKLKSILHQKVDLILLVL